jgi:hypothetical protein
MNKIFDGTADYKKELSPLLKGLVLAVHFTK